MCLRNYLMDFDFIKNSIMNVTLVHYNPLSYTNTKFLICETS
jgi:hypothetical protein